MTADAMRLFHLVNLTDEQAAMFAEVVEAIEYPLWRCAPKVAGDMDGAVLVKAVEFGMGVDGYWTGSTMEIHLDITSPNVRTNIVHEIGHMVDACVLDSSTRRDVMDLMHEPGNVRGDHEDHRRVWNDHYVDYRMRFFEAFADAFSYHYARPVWDEGTHWRTRFHHLVADEYHDQFNEILMRSPMSLPVDRLAGPSRIETAVAVSQHRFPESADVVYIATADDWPDTISAGALAQDGPLLLVQSVGPAHPAVVAEVERLAPMRLVAVGGESAVPQLVMDKLAALS